MQLVVQRKHGGRHAAYGWEMVEGTLRGVADPSVIRAEVRRLLLALLGQVEAGKLRSPGGTGREVELLEGLSEALHASSGIATEELLPLRHADGRPILDESFVLNPGGCLVAYLSRADDSAEQQHAIREFAARHDLAIAAFIDENEATPKEQFSLDMIVKGTGAGLEQALDLAWDEDGALVTRRMTDLGNNITTVLWRIGETQGDAQPPILTAAEGLDTSSAGGSVFARALQSVREEAKGIDKQEFQRNLALAERYRAEYGGADQILNDLIAGKDVPSFEVWKQWRSK